MLLTVDLHRGLEAKFRVVCKVTIELFYYVFGRESLAQVLANKALERQIACLADLVHLEAHGRARLEQPTLEVLPASARLHDQVLRAYVNQSHLHSNQVLHRGDLDDWNHQSHFVFQVLHRHQFERVELWQVVRLGGATVSRPTLQVL